MSDEYAIQVVVSNLRPPFRYLVTLADQRSFVELYARMLRLKHDIDDGALAPLIDIKKNNRTTQNQSGGPSTNNEANMKADANLVCQVDTSRNQNSYPRNSGPRNQLGNNRGN